MSSTSGDESTTADGFETYRRRLYEVMEDDAPSVVEKQRRVLELGCEYLGVENGHVERVDGDTHEVTVSVGGDEELLPEGEHLPRGKTYCRRTVQRDSPLALSDAPEQGWADDPAYREHGFDCYLGTKISVDGDLYGTVCFVSRSAKPGQFDGTERAFIELVARLFGRELESARYEAELAEREDELRVKNRAIGEASVGVSIADASREDLPLVYVNDEFVEMTGYRRETVLGKNCRFLQGRHTDPEATDAVREAIEAREPITTELLNYRRDGTPFWNELTVTPVRDEAGEVTHFVGFQRDVTERKRRERLVTVLNRVLRHNLRNDMNAVAGLAGMLSSAVEGDAAEAAERIESIAWHLADLGETARELEACMRDPISERPVDVTEVVEGVADRLRADYPDATVRTEAPDDATALATDRLDDVLYELGENAVEHGTPPERDGESAPSVSFAVAPTAEGGVRVRVADDGPGLPAMEREVLENGRETPLEHGSGLGLWYVNWVVTGFGGGIDVTVEDGTTVTVALPPADDAGGDCRGAAICTDD